MPRYEFQCEQGCSFDAHYSMQKVPRQANCTRCGGTAIRRITAPHLSRAGSPAARLLDQTARSAHEPAVVDRLPGGAPRPQRATSNPLHSKLPRP